MFQLILTVIGLSLIAGLSVVTANYLPAWAPAAKDTHVLVENGAKTLINAFNLRAEANGGVAPMYDSGYPGNGLAVFFSDYYSFLPRAPQGYAWSYGFSNSVALATYGYAGGVSNNGTPEDPADDGLFWFCLYPVDSGASEGIHRGMRRAQQVFSTDQMYVNSVDGCGIPQNNVSVPTNFPASTVVTIFVRYVPGNP